MDSPVHQSGTSSSDESLDHKPPIARVVNHFVGAKKALSSSGNAWRATKIVSDAKKSIENIATIDSKVEFLREGINEVVTHIRKTRDAMGIVERDIGKEFKVRRLYRPYQYRTGSFVPFPFLTWKIKEILRDLDVADARVKEAIQSLKNTKIEPNLRPIKEEAKTLHDFVDEKGVDDLTAVFRECIDHTNEAQNNFAESALACDREIQEIQDKLALGHEIDLGYENTESVGLFHSLESHATEVADLLQSLVRHYDLCFTALKHTEGADEATIQIHEDLPPGVSINHGSEPRATPHPTSDEEKAEMLRVLDQDAEEVQDVVDEIRDRVSEMEAPLDRIVRQEVAQRSENDKIMEVISLLGTGDHAKKRYLVATALFIGRWKEIKQRIEERLAEMNNLRDFFVGFLQAYDGLLVEVVRRRSVQGRIDRIIKESMSKVDTLLDEDTEEREAFRSEHGEYLPSDIWLGLAQSPVRPEVRKGDEKGREIPNIPAEVFQRARNRIRKR